MCVELSRSRLPRYELVDRRIERYCVIVRAVPQGCTKGVAYGTKYRLMDGLSITETYLGLRRVYIDVNQLRV
jgi:hypothetical protein